MARGRAQLSEKEERILIQAQLMGLDTSSMVRIGNRLRAIDKERDDLAKVDAAINGLSWTRPEGTSNWIITRADGKIFHCEYHRRDSRTWGGYKVVWKIHVSKPGTRFNNRTIDDVEVYVTEDLPKRMMPEKSRELFALTQSITRGRFD